MSDKKAIFLDKDGTLIRDVPYNTDPEKIELLAGVLLGLQRLHSRGYMFFIVTNQSGVAKGYFDEQALEGVAERMRQLLGEYGVTLSGFYFCPHHPDGSVKSYSRYCDCRKPSPGLLLKAAGAYGINLKESWMLGDILDDVEAGNRAGCRTILIDPLGQERRRMSGGYRTPSFIAENFGEATDLVLMNASYGKV